MGVSQQIDGKTHHSGQTGPQLEQNLPLLRLLIEDVQSRSAFEGAQPAEVRERREVEVLGLGHSEAPDEEVEEARVVHVYGGGCRVAGDGQASMSRVQAGRRSGVAPPLRPGGTEGQRAPPAAPRRPRPSAPRPPSASSALYPARGWPGKRHFSYLASAIVARYFRITLIDLPRFGRSAIFGLWMIWILFLFLTFAKSTLA